MPSRGEHPHVRYLRREMQVWSEKRFTELTAAAALNTALEARIQSLETSNANMQQEINQLKTQEAQNNSLILGLRNDVDSILAFLGL